MDTLTIIIKMTGLLLMVPPGPGGGPTHMVLPATGNSVPPHVALLAYATPTRKDHCLGYDSISQMCFVNLEGWSLEPVPAAGVNNGPPIPPSGMASVTLGSGGLRVPRSLLGGNPGRKVRSSLVLNRGGTTRECPPALFTFDPIGAAVPEDTLALTSVLEWTIRIAGDSLPLVRTPLDRTSTDSAETLDVLRPDSGAIELFILHLPVWEDGGFLLTRDATAAQRESPSSVRQSAGASHAHADSMRWEATHFHAYYDMVRARRNERRLPRFLRPTNASCDWGLMTLRGQAIGVRSPTTFTCMLATAESR